MKRIKKPPKKRVLDRVRKIAEYFEQVGKIAKSIKDVLELLITLIVFLYIIIKVIS